MTEIRGDGVLALTIAVEVNKSRSDTLRTILPTDVVRVKVLPGGRAIEVEMLPGGKLEIATVDSAPVLSLLLNEMLAAGL